MKQRGFSLMNTVVTLAVIAIFAGIAVPSYRSMTLNISLNTQANDMARALSYARMEAIRRNEQVSVIAIDDNWRNGLQVVTVNGSQVLREVEAPANPADINTEVDTVVFSPSGFADASKSFIYCDERDNEQGYWLQVASSGRVRSCTIAAQFCENDADDVNNDVDGGGDADEQSEVQCA